MDSAAYRDKQLKKKYDEINNPKRPTEGQLLGESGDYLKDPETEVDTSQPLQSATNPLDDLTINPNRKTLTEAEKRLQDKLRKRAGTGQQGADIAKEKLEKKGGSATDLPPFLQVHKEADPIIKEGIAEDMAQNAARDKAIEEVIKSTEPKSQERLQGLKDIAQQLGEDSLGYGLMALQKYGEAIDWTNDQVNLRNSLPFLRGVETPIDALLDYSYKDLRDDVAGGIGNVVGAVTGSETANTVAETGAQIFLPDAMDFATGGVGYLDNIGRATLKLRKADGKFINDAVNFADNLVFQIRQKLGGEGNLELAGIGMRINKNNITDTFYQSKGVSKGGGGINPIRQPEVPQLIRQHLSRIGSRDGVYDHAAHLIYKKGKVISSKESRNIVALFETDPMQYIRGKGGKILDFDSYSKTQTKKFWDVYGPELAKRGVKRKSIQLHHINSLQASIGLFDGIQWGSKEWYDLTGHLAKNFISTGNNPKNLMRITGDALTDKGTPHYLTHKFLDKRVGKQGELFFTTSRVEDMKKSWATRLEMANDFSSIVKESEAIAVQTQKAWDLIYGVSEEVPEKLVEFMSQLPANKDYQLPELRELAVQAITDLNLLPKGKKAKLPTQEAILKFIKDGNVRQKTIFDENPSELNRIMQESKPPANIPKRKYRKKKKNPDQTELNE